jgi:hypothetical protein
MESFIIAALYAAGALLMDAQLDAAPSRLWRGAMVVLWPFVVAWTAVAFMLMKLLK